jgi:oligopeptide transport system substrate-binding protein
MSKNARWVVIAVLVLLACALVALCVAASLAAVRYFSAPVDSGTPSVRGTPRAASAGKGGVLRLWGSDPVTLDPALVTDAYSAGYVLEIFSGLVSLDERLQVTPDIAERWEVSPDGRTYTFRLREDVRFHDGKAVTAHDFKYSLERACDPALGSRVALTYLGDIVGAEALIRGQAREIVGVQVLDDHTLELNIDSPKAYFLAKLTYSTAFVVDQQNVEQGGSLWTAEPNGTGPFKLAERDGDRIVLFRNEGYYAGLPPLERVEYTLRGGDPVSMYEDGYLDVVEVGISDIERVTDPSNPLHADLLIVPQLDVHYLGMNTELAPFDDPKVRQAFGYAVDREKIATVVLKDTVVPTIGILPPGLRDFEGEEHLLVYDPDRARQLLQESSYGGAQNLPPIVLHIGGDSGILPRTVEALLAMYSDNLGVDLSVEEAAWPSFLQDVEA